MSSYDLILKKEDKKIVLEYASIKGEKGEKGDTGDVGPQGKQGERGPQGLRGKQGKQGKPLGIASHELLEDNQTKIVFDDEKNTTILIPPGKDGYTPIKDKDYFDGKDGVSPVIDTKEEDDGYLITLTDNKKKNEIKLLHGKDGERGLTGEIGPKGPQGEQGKPAEPLTVTNQEFDEKGNTILTLSDDTVVTINKGADGKMTFEDLTPEQKAGLKGEKGEQGPKGEPGKDGEDGKPGPKGDSFTFDDLTEDDISSIKSQLKVEDDIQSTVSKTKSELEEKIEQGLSSKAEQKELESLSEQVQKKIEEKDIEDFVTNSEVQQIVSSSAPTVKAGTSINVSDGTINLANVNGSNIRIWVGSSDEYNSIYYKKSDTLYFVKE